MAWLGKSTSFVSDKQTDEAFPLIHVTNVFYLVLPKPVGWTCLYQRMRMHLDKLAQLLD